MKRPTESPMSEWPARPSKALGWLRGHSLWALGWALCLGMASAAWGDTDARYRITGVPAGETLNIRTGPGTNFPVAAELPNGKEGIRVTGAEVMNGEAEWVPISYPGGKGWTRTKYLAPTTITMQQRPVTVEKKLPIATLEPTVPGYVRSPFTDTPRLVDARGMHGGERVVCPYTQRPFLLPSMPNVPASGTKVSQKTSRPALESKPNGSQDDDALPYAIPYPGKPGFVSSPYMAKNFLVDVTGRPVGMEVKCPYSGKCFLVPAFP